MMRISLPVTLLLIPFVTGAQTSSPVASWDFEEIQAGRFIFEGQSNRLTILNSPFRTPEWVDGPNGRALRLDGYTTSFSFDLDDADEPQAALTLEAWVAVDYYPVTNAPWINQYTFPSAGYFFGMDPWGAWYIAVSSGGFWRTCWGAELFPKGRWVHIAGVFDSANGRMSLYLDGNPAGTLQVPRIPLTVDPSTRMTVAKDVHSPVAASGSPFETGLMGGLIDEVKLYNRVLTRSEITASYLRGNPPALPSLNVPSERYDKDRHRPKYHPIPPENWTNEPHGLVREENGRYHLFYQHNPAGPYWRQIHWGHMSSWDLVQWHDEPIALAPEKGWDRAGIWSGDAVIDDERLSLIYTGVDGAKAGIGLARSTDASYQTFMKIDENPVIERAPGGVTDFRDPFVWQENDTWHMIVGSGRAGQGGAALHYTGSRLREWNLSSDFFHTAPESIAGHFWEMPVFVNLGTKYALVIVTVEVPNPARTLYWIGDWDGITFTPSHTIPKQLDLINHLLSPSVTTDMDGRTAAIGIIPEIRSAESVMADGWANLFSLPRVWSLCNEDTLCQSPHPNLKALRSEHVNYKNLTVSGAQQSHLPDLSGKELEIVAVIDPNTATQAGLDLLRSASEVTRIYYDQTEESFVLDLRRSSNSSAAFDDQLKTSPFQLPPDTPLELHVFVDHSVIEVFVNGTAAFSTRTYPIDPASIEVDLFASGGSAFVRSVDVWGLSRRVTGFSEDPQSPSFGSAVTLYPNPFEGKVTLEYHVETPSPVVLEVFDVLGRKVREDIHGNQAVGIHTMYWDGRNDWGLQVPNGLYFYQLRLGQQMSTGKMILKRP